MHEFVVSNRDKVELFLHEPALEEVRRRKKPTRYFWCDMTDMFLDDYPFEWLDKIFATMALTPHHTHLVLTKRPARMLEYFRDLAYRTEMIGIEAEYISGIDRFIHPTEPWRTTPILPRWTLPLPNVHLGVSIENQDTAKRLYLLAQTPAVVRFCSYEPALSHVNFKRIELGEGLLWDAISGAHEAPANSNHIPLPPLLPGLSQLIVGGESGPFARGFDLDWARDARRQCGILTRFFMKQAGSAPYDSSVTASGRSEILFLKDRKGGDITELPEELRIREYSQ